DPGKASPAERGGHTGAVPAAGGRARFGRSTEIDGAPAGKGRLGNRPVELQEPPDRQDRDIENRSQRATVIPARASRRGREGRQPGHPPVTLPLGDSREVRWGNSVIPG